MRCVSLFLLFCLKDEEVPHCLVDNIQAVNRGQNYAQLVKYLFESPTYQKLQINNNNLSLSSLHCMKKEVPDYRVCPAPIKSSSCILRSSSFECSTNDDCQPGTRCCSVECCPGSCRKECVEPVLPG